MIRNLLPNSQRADNIHCIKMIPKDRKKGKKKRTLQLILVVYP